LRFFVTFFVFFCYVSGVVFDVAKHGEIYDLPILPKVFLGGFF